MAPNKLDLSFPPPNYCAKFHQILFKIATVGAMTDTHRQTDRRQRSYNLSPIAMGQIMSSFTSPVADSCPYRSRTLVAVCEQAQTATRRHHWQTSNPVAVTACSREESSQLLPRCPANSSGEMTRLFVWEYRWPSL